MSPMKSGQEAAEQSIPPMDQRLTDALKQNMPTLLPGEYQPLEGAPDTNEFSQLNASGLNANVTGETVYSKFNKALDAAGVGSGQVVSQHVTDTRCTVGILFEDVDHRTSVNLNFDKDTGGLRITINKSSKKKNE